MDLDLAGRVAVVTGGSKGIGLAVTRALLAEGARVVVASRSRTPELDALSGEVRHVPADFMDPSAPAEVIARAVEEFGGLDILVNNAGGPPPGTKMPQFGFLGLTDAGWQSMFEFNLFSTVRACRAALPLLIERGGGAIVNVSSGHGRQPSGVNVDYGAAKAAMMNLTKALSEEFGPQGVRVNGVCPGPVKTPWWTDAGGAADIFAAHIGSDRDSVLTSVAPQMMQLATGRLIEPSEIADVVALLVSPRSASTTGAEFVVDAGWLKST
ncbi:MAG TPA: SDR family NAD(P)-dependent oxidoreductase [Pseudonocardia sp.]|jgi:NAD(P)-dependent dehydrogenase (short-subunit alcohol dehydrogenase family)|uniref:SDR family NAD(P)-dependent oxidoreductase n=1 Tax=Pseudonocardia sp. TaxID=60912 RepID=UPI002C0023E3|nr:SDR family NAD(P)-dependent oxidoreductase [Pseudonocardia sp.]HTF49943.1 SDR family NAD(P)-dependent oxidoreductase [Pseudonocardia sp.]